MKTYKFLLVALIATGFFAACTNEPVIDPVKMNEPSEIAFRLQGGTPDIVTRALATTIANLDAFVVFGTDDVLDASSDLILDGVTVARQLGGAFTYSPRAYYSAGVTSAGFFAFSPVSANVTFSSPAGLLSSVVSFDYEVLRPDNTGNISQEDFLVADTTVTGSTALAATVDLAFRHALSRIFVTATNDAADPVIITGLKLMNLITKGSLDVDLSTGWAWTPSALPTDTANYEYQLAPSGGVVVQGGTIARTLVTSMEQGMMILPQVTQITGTGDVTAGDFALEVTYEFANFGTQTRYVYIPEVSPGVGYEFEAGNQYNIYISFDGLLPIEFDVIQVDSFGAPINVNP